MLVVQYAARCGRAVAALCARHGAVAHAQILTGVAETSFTRGVFIAIVLGIAGFAETRRGASGGGTDQGAHNEEEHVPPNFDSAPPSL